MPGQTYMIDFTDSSLPGKTPFTIEPGTFDGPEQSDNNKKHTSINLFGQGYLRYGEKANENFLHLLENFAGKDSPPNPTIGQLWFDANTNSLKVYNISETWVSAGGVSFPSNFNILSSNSTNKQFVIEGDVRNILTTGTKFFVNGTGTANDGQVFTVTGTPSFNGTNTTVTVVETVASSTIPGGNAYYTQQPSTPLIGQLWFDIATQTLKVWKGTVWEPVVLQGGSSSLTLSGNLDMSTNRIVNLATPVNSTDATTKQYVDSQINTRVSKSGDTMTGNLTGTAFRATQGAPNNSDSSTVGFAFGSDGDTGLFSPIVGGGGANGVVSLFANSQELLRGTPSSITLYQPVTANNFITLHTNPINAMHAVTKQYVDNIAGTTGGNLSAHANDFTLHLTPAQNTWIDAITATSTEVNYLSGVTSNIQTQLNARVNKAGDTMTGFLTLHANPTSAMHAATKQYVDSVAGSSVPSNVALINPGTPKNGDIQVNTSPSLTISIYANGAWRQVFPAVYS